MATCVIPCELPYRTLIISEILTLISAMRKNSRWASGSAVAFPSTTFSFTTVTTTTTYESGVNDYLEPSGGGGANGGLASSMGLRRNTGGSNGGESGNEKHVTASVSTPRSGIGKERTEGMELMEAFMALRAELREVEGMYFPDNLLG